MYFSGARGHLNRFGCAPGIAGRCRVIDWKGGVHRERRKPIQGSGIRNNEKITKLFLGPISDVKSSDATKVVGRERTTNPVEAATKDLKVLLGKIMKSDVRSCLLPERFNSRQPVIKVTNAL